MMEVKQRVELTETRGGDGGQTKSGAHGDQRR